MRVLYVSITSLILAVVAVVGVYRLSGTGAVVESQVLAAVSTPKDKNVSFMIDEINQIRSGVGVTTLVFNPELQPLTDFRTSDMATKYYYSHKTPDGYTYANYISEYYPESTYSCENLQLQVGGDFSNAVKSWVGSQSHYRCLTNPNVSNVAISYSMHGDPLYDANNQPRQMYIFTFIASN